MKYPWKQVAKQYRYFYSLTLEQAREWQAKAHKYQAINAEMLEALRAVEWIYDSELDDDFCPYCGNAQYISGHDINCKISIAIAKAEGK